MKWLWIAMLLHASLPLWAQVAVHLPEAINSEYEERQPVLSPDGKTLYFWRRNTPGNSGGTQDNGDIWYAEKYLEGNWAKAKRMSAPLNGLGLNFIWQVSPNGDTLYLHYLADGVPTSSSAGVAYSVRQYDGTWGKPKRMYVQGYRFQGRYKDFFLTSKRVLLLPNAGREALGGADIFAYFPVNDSTWGNPVHLPAPINTIYEEDAPCMSADGNWLFFSSDRNDKTDHDIFCIRRLDDTWLNWSQPQLVGLPINTRVYDFDLRPTPDGKHLYWGSNNETYGGTDIFSYTLPTCGSEVSVFPAGEQAICEGDTLFLAAGFALHDSLGWQWNTGKMGRTLAVTSAGNYRVVRYLGRCADTSAYVHVRMLPKPSAEIMATQTGLCDGQSVRLSVVAQPETRLQWLLNGQAIPKSTTATLDAIAAGTYMLAGWNGRCFAICDTVVLSSAKRPRIQADAGSWLAPPATPSWKAIAENPLIFDSIFSSTPTDALGNTFAMGRFNDTIQGISQQYLLDIVSKRGNVYVAKFSPNGTPIWVRHFPAEGYSHDFGHGVQLDEKGNVYIAGGFGLTANFGEAVLRATPALNTDHFFVAKYDPLGNFQWARRVSAAVPANRSSDFTVDKEGNSYLLAHGTVSAFSPNGEALYIRTVQSPTTPLRLRVAALDSGYLAIAGICTDNTRFAYIADTTAHLTPLREVHPKGKVDGFVPSLAWQKNTLYVAKENGVSAFSRDVDDRMSTLILAPKDTAHLYTESIGGATYQWFRNNTPLEGATQPTYKTSRTGNYTVQRTLGSCIQTSTIVQVRQQDVNSPIKRIDK